MAICLWCLQTYCRYIGLQYSFCVEPIQTELCLMQDIMTKKDMAVKIVTLPNIAEKEIRIWPKLKHDHIVPLINMFSLDHLEVVIFVMPVLKMSLHDVICRSRFINRQGSYRQVKVWLFEILCAFDYLAKHHLCHLDVKVDNVLISDANAAMLCDFSFLNVTTGPLTRNDLGLPYIYRPPEACLTVDEDTTTILGIAYDMWGYGMMVIEILTSFVMAIEIPDCKCWIDDVYPLLFNTLKESKFFKLLKKAFPNSNIDRKETEVALNFVQCFAFHSPEKRVTPKKGMMHKFLGKQNWICSLNDPMWIDADYFNTDSVSYGGSSGDTSIDLSTFEDDYTIDSPANKHPDLEQLGSNYLIDTKPHFNDQTEPQSKLNLTLGCTASDTDLVIKIKRPTKYGRSYSFPTTDHLRWDVDFCVESPSEDQFDLLSRCEPLMSEGYDHKHVHDQPGSSEPDEYYDERKSRRENSVKSPKDFEFGRVMITEENKNNDSETDDAPNSGGQNLENDKEKKICSTRMDFIPWLRNKFGKIGNFFRNRSHRGRKT